MQRLHVRPLTALSDLHNWEAYGAVTWEGHQLMSSEMHRTVTEAEMLDFGMISNCLLSA